MTPVGRRSRNGASTYRPLSARKGIKDDQGLSLFDERDLAKIAAPDAFPGERLIVCRNLLLAGERARKREDPPPEAEAPPHHPAATRRFPPSSEFRLTGFCFTMPA